MILRFREGSALHAELKRMNDVREATYKEACNIIEELVGERPVAFGYCWGWGFACAWNPCMVAFKDGFVPDPKLMSENPEASNREHKAYKVLRTTKKAGKRRINSRNSTIPSPPTVWKSWVCLFIQKIGISISCPARMKPGTTSRLAMV